MPWKDLTKLYKFTSNERCEIWTPRATKRTKKRRRKSQKNAQTTPIIQMPSPRQNHHSNAMKKNSKIVFGIRTLDEEGNKRSNA